MTIDWRPLDAELEHWTQDRSLPFWWRDDDAVAKSPALDRLRALSDATGLPVHVAVIPSQASRPLARLLRDDPRTTPLVHGWAHINHAPHGASKSEFGANRPVDSMRAEVIRARERLSDLTGAPVAPVFVPPWNRISPELLPHLSMAGYSVISTYTPRDSVLAAPGLTRINTHLDPIDWRGNRSSVNADTLIAKTAGQLADRRFGRADAAEPYGILTHHLVHDEAIWSLTEQILQRFARAGLALWSATGDLADEPT